MQLATLLCKVPLETVLSQGIKMLAENNIDVKPERLLKFNDLDWYVIECKEGGKWTGGIAGTQEWLGLSDEQVAKAYPYYTKDYRK
jgi:hypothetical protein